MNATDSTIRAHETVHAPDASAERLRHAESQRLIALSIAAAIANLLLKFAAYRVTNSVGLLSDAVESSANVVAALTALGAIWYASRPADADHPYGHEKIEFFSSGIEGALVLGAAIAIAWAGALRLAAPTMPENLAHGVWLVLLATAINWLAARALLKAGKRLDSIVLEADGQHLMSDVWTSGGVLLGLILARATGWPILDPLLAIFIALNIARIGWNLLSRSFHGLMDHALSRDEIQQIRDCLQEQLREGETYHALRTRRAGSRLFVDYHLLMAGETSLKYAHDREMEIGNALQIVLPALEITTHIEPLEEPLAWNDARVE